MNLDEYKNKVNDTTSHVPRGTRRMRLAAALLVGGAGRGGAEQEEESRQQGCWLKSLPAGRSVEAKQPHLLAHASCWPAIGLPYLTAWL